MRFISLVSFCYITLIHNYFVNVGLVGTEMYSEAVVAASRVLAARRRDRRAVQKAEFVTQPDKAAQMRIKKHFAKRVAKKVKIARLKGVRPKLKNLAMKKRNVK